MVVLISVSLSHFLTSYPHHFSLCHLSANYLACARSLHELLESQKGYNQIAVYLTDALG